VIVERWTLKSSQGHSSDELADLVLSELAAQKERGNYSRPFRAYTPKFSGQPMNLLILEWEYEGLAERDRVWAEWWELPTTLAYMEKWQELHEWGSIIREIWDLRTP
jgi:hypothetical protein